MAKKKLLVVSIMVFSLLLFPLTALGAGHGSASSGFYSTETLAEFDGTDDNPAYVGYHGRIYDLSDTFADGSHAGHDAGMDLTEEFYEAHEAELMEGREVVGYYLSRAMTEEELANYDGHNDNPAYVAVDGIIYDGSDTFSDGTHGGHEAGQDLTDEFQGQHGEDTLMAMPVVGALVSYELTLDELAEYDGQDGNDAFVAVDGFIFDVTESFEDGEHFGHEAGQDLTDEIEEADHLRSVLPDVPVVGVLVE
ncbi:hypothetical protein I0Q91_07980 [Halanaerobiaceae bacterium Z-7014]|uniref:Cytochrome b5 heme-binding domain-containing protein n=1 Tax=Halonatronomonas betaini TaxID=2778430 RepID=A0A931AVR7_9FIRM|nr:cytochrome b5 domain-containing protein [Halonatronomonas betaini]MBF8437011.1 hypothetical protein [Halonatronomonas betaini]